MIGGVTIYVLHHCLRPKMADVSNVANCGDNIESLVNDVPGLSEEEKTQLMSVMLKAKELDVQEENKMRLPFEGQLSKYTNVMRGWQYRWFVLNPETGYLEYYMVVEGYKKPRGAVHLAGAVISPSDEDSQSFTLSAVCGEVYKLRASNAKERQFWVNRLRAVAEYHIQHIAKKNPPLNNRDQRLSSENSNNSKSGQDQKPLSTWYNAQSVPTTCTSPNSPVINSLASVADALSSVKDGLQLAGKRHQTLTKVIEELPTCGHAAKCLDTDMLLLKATAHATMQCLEQCYSILQHQQLAANFPSGLPAGATVEWVEPQRTPPIIRRPLETYPKSPLVHLSSAS